MQNDLRMKYKWIYGNKNMLIKTATIGLSLKSLTYYMQIHGRSMASLNKYRMPVMEVPQKLLMGPGPSNASQEVLSSMSSPLLGHLHPEFIKIMDDVKDGIRYMFQTENAWTMAVSGTGHAALEMSLVNLIEPGTVVLVGVHGEWGIRASDIAERMGADVRQVSAEPGTSISLDSIKQALEEHKPDVFFLCHSESSTGVMHPLDGIGDLCHKHSCLFIVDTVASAGGVPIFTDKLGIDVIYCGTQKVLSAPPAPSPISFSDRAMERILKRQRKVQSFYFDATMLGNYWGCDGAARRYHHTGMISNTYALREALRQLAEKGLNSSWTVHKSCAERLWAGLCKLGLKLLVQDESMRLPTVTTVLVPSGVDAKQVIDHMMSRYKVEISGGLGPTAGRVWRIGLMGVNATPDNVDLVLKGLREALQAQQWTGASPTSNLC